MIGLYIIYGLLIAIAVAIFPFRVRARRQTLKEIAKLRSALKLNTEQLVSSIEAISTRNLAEHTHPSEADRVLHLVLTECNSYSFLLKTIESEWMADVDCWMALGDYDIAQYCSSQFPSVFKLERREQVGGSNLYKRLVAAT